MTSCSSSSPAPAQGRPVPRSRSSATGHTTGRRAGAAEDGRPPERTPPPGPEPGPCQRSSAPAARRSTASTPRARRRTAGTSKVPKAFPQRRMAVAGNADVRSWDTTRVAAAFSRAGWEPRADHQNPGDSSTGRAARIVAIRRSRKVTTDQCRERCGSGPSGCTNAVGAPVAARSGTAEALGPDGVAATDRPATGRTSTGQGFRVTSTTSGSPGQFNSAETEHHRRRLLDLVDLPLDALREHKHRPHPTDEQQFLGDVQHRRLLQRARTRAVDDYVSIGGITINESRLQRLRQRHAIEQHRTRTAVGDRGDEHQLDGCGSTCRRPSPSGARRSCRKQYIVDLTSALKARRGARGSSGEIQLTNLVVSTLAR